MITPATLTQPSSRNFTEPAYWNVSAVANAAALTGAATYTVVLPLSHIKETIFALDKNMYFGGNLTYLKLFMGPLTKIAFQSTSNVNPSLETPNTYAPGVGAGSAQIENLQLMLNVEVDQYISQDIMNSFSAGVSMIIPYPISYKNSNAGTTQTINIQFDAGNGRSLSKLIHSIWSSTEQNDTMYDCSNNPLNDGSVQPQKCVQYYTQLNSRRLQNINLDCSLAGPFTDYMSHRDQFRGSVIQNRNIYQWNWHHCDDFSQFGPNYNQDSIAGNELIAGIPMGDQKALTWQFNGTVMIPPNSNITTYQHYTWAIFTRKLTINFTGVTC